MRHSERCQRRRRSTSASWTTSTTFRTSRSTNVLVEAMGPSTVSLDVHLRQEREYAKIQNKKRLQRQESFSNRVTQVASVMEAEARAEARKRKADERREVREHKAAQRPPKRKYTVVEDRERELIVMAHKRGDKTQVELAKDFNRSVDTIHSVLRTTEKNNGDHRRVPPEAEKKAGRKKKLTAGQIGIIARWWSLKPWWTAREACAKVLQLYNISISRRTLSDNVKTRIGLRPSDFLNVPYQRNLPRIIKWRRKWVDIAVVEPTRSRLETAFYMDEAHFWSNKVKGRGPSFRVRETRTMACRPP